MPKCPSCSLRSTRRGQFCPLCGGSMVPGASQKSMNDDAQDMLQTAVSMPPIGHTRKGRQSRAPTRPAPSPGMTGIGSSPSVAMPPLLPPLRSVRRECGGQFRRGMNRWRQRFPSPSRGSSPGFQHPRAPVSAPSSAGSGSSQARAGSGRHGPYRRIGHLDLRRRGTPDGLFRAHSLATPDHRTSGKRRHGRCVSRRRRQARQPCR